MTTNDYCNLLFFNVALPPQPEIDLERPEGF